MSDTHRYITPHEASRIKRMTVDRGHFIHCSHYKKTGTTTFYCNKQKKTKRNCEGCFTCPNCGGLMYTDRLKKERNRNSIYVTHTKTCHLCGAYIEEHMVGFVARQEQKRENSCQVQGCMNTAYEGHIHEDGNKTFQICEKHRNRMKSWRQHPTKGEDQKPLIMQLGVLIDNPRYTIKQGKRK